MGRCNNILKRSFRTFLYKYLRTYKRYLKKVRKCGIRFQMLENFFMRILLSTYNRKYVDVCVHARVCFISDRMQVFLKGSNLSTVFASNWHVLCAICIETRAENRPELIKRYGGCDSSHSITAYCTVLHSNDN